MSTLLLTRLHPPPQPPTALDRPRLLDRLDGGAGGKLTVIHAPAGYGKTTLAAAWTAVQAQRPDGRAVAWLTLEPFDNDPTRFLNYFVAAWQQIDPTFGRDVVAAARANQFNPLPAEPVSLLNTLINQLLSHPAPLALVLDDWHTVTDDGVRRLMQYWIEHVPPHVHTLLTSRTLPAMPLARWRARGQFTVVDARALRFTRPEVGRFLREGLKLALSAADVDRLAAATEGWIGALQLLALSLQGEADVAAQLARLGNRDHYLIAFLTEEVLSQQPDEVRRFLAETAVLDQFNADLCAAVTGRDDSRTLLASLAQRSLLVTPLDDAGGWYRYHPLLATALREQLAAAAPQQFQTLHSRAFDWLAAQDRADEAISHGLAAQRFADVSRLLLARADALVWRGGQAATLAGWCEQLPAERLAATPRLALAYGWALVFLSRFDDLAQHIRDLQDRDVASATLSDAGGADIRSEWLALQAEIDLYRGDIDGVLAKLAPIDFDALRHPRLRAMMRQVQGYAQRLDGRVDDAISTLQQVRQTVDPQAHPALWLYAGTDLAEVHLLQGDLAAAESIYRQLLANQPDESRPVNPLLDLVWIGYAKLLFRRNQLNEALDLAQRGVAMSRAVGAARTVTRAGLALLAQIQQAHGAWADAQTLLQQVAALVGLPPNARVRFAYELLHARLHVLQGESDAAAAWVNRLGPERPSGVTRLQFHAARLVRARWLLPRDPVAALPLLAACRAEAAARGWGELELEAAVLQAGAHQRLNQPDDALAQLRSAALLARPGGYVRPFVEQAADLAPLLRGLSSEQELMSFIGQIQAAFLPTGVTTQPLVDPLTPREIEILQLIGAGLTNPEIAARLIIATGTVARHTNNIFGKLGVRNRTEATLRARRLGLIAT